MKQGPAENMTTAVLKQLGLKDKGIAFSSKAKQSELVQIFNTRAAYDGCFPNAKQFYFADKHPQNKSDSHVVDSCQRT